VIANALANAPVNTIRTSSMWSTRLYVKGAKIWVHKVVYHIAF
jgi:hypothetical protein